MDQMIICNVKVIHHIDKPTENDAPTLRVLVFQLIVLVYGSQLYRFGSLSAFIHLDSNREAPKTHCTRTCPVPNIRQS